MVSQNELMVHMLNKKDLENKVQSIFDEQFPEETEKYNIRIVDADSINPESDTVKRLVLDFQLASNSQQYNSTSQMFRSCRVLATSFCEPELVDELNTIYFGRIDGFSVPLLQWIFLKGLKIGGLKNIYRINDEELSMGIVNEKLEDKKTAIYEIFGKIQKKYSFKQAEFDWSKQVGNKEANIDFDSLGV